MAMPAHSLQVLTCCKISSISTAISRRPSSASFICSKSRASLFVGLSSLLGSIVTMFTSFLGGIARLIGSLIVTAVGLVAVRISTELIMVFFQNNEHLAAIRARAEGRRRYRDA